MQMLLLCSSCPYSTQEVFLPRNCFNFLHFLFPFLREIEEANPISDSFANMKRPSSSSDRVPSGRRKERGGESDVKRKKGPLRVFWVFTFLSSRPLICWREVDVYFFSMSPNPHIWDIFQGKKWRGNGLGIQHWKGNNHAMRARRWLIPYRREKEGIMSDDWWARAAAIYFPSKIPCRVPHTCSCKSTIHCLKIFMLPYLRGSVPLTDILICGP